MTTNQFRLSGAWNYRDVGGLRTTDGAAVRPGLLHRASALRRLDDDGRAALVDLGITDVFDLRSDNEVEREGADLTPDSVLVHRTPYWNDPKASAPHDEPKVPDEERAIEHAVRYYTRFPTLDGAADAIRAVVDAIVTGRGGVLVHCAAGKDRAGWTVATVLRAAGVSDEDVLADFLRSNDAIAPLRQDVARIWGDEHVGRVTDAMLGVREDYYRAGLAEVNRVHGSFGGYLDALGIDAETLEKLRAALVENPQLPV